MSSVSKQKFDLEALHSRSSTDRQSTSPRPFLTFLEIFSHLMKKNIIATLLKFTGYIHNHKILTRSIFGLILKNKMAATFFFFKFAGYVPHYKILTEKIFGLILKNKMAATGVSLSVMKSAYISLIIGPRGLVCQANL